MPSAARILELLDRVREARTKVSILEKVEDELRAAPAGDPRRLDLLMKSNAEEINGVRMRMAMLEDELLRSNIRPGDIARD